MATRLKEGKKPYTGGQAIEIDENKVISLRLRDENNLIIYDEGDDEIYVDLQLPDEITPTDAFPIGVNTGRVVVDNGWDKAGTIISAKTTSGDVIKLVYADEGTLWIDNGTGTFKQIYFKSDVDGIITTLTTYINTELAKKQNGVASTTAPSNPSEGDLWYDTTNDEMKVYDGSQWNLVGTGGGGSDIVYATQAEYTALLPGALTDNKHYFIYSTDGGGGWQPGVNTVAYYPLDSINTVNDLSGNNYNLTNTNVTFGTYDGVDCAYFNGNALLRYTDANTLVGTTRTFSIWGKFPLLTSLARVGGINYYGNSYGDYGRGGLMLQNSSLTINVGDGVQTFGNITVNSGWNHIVLAQDGANICIYVNGNLEYTGSSMDTAGSGASSNSITIGTKPAYAPVDAKITGYVGETIVEDAQRTATDVADYFNATKANYGIS